MKVFCAYDRLTAASLGEEEVDKTQFLDGNAGYDDLADESVLDLIRDSD